MTEPNGRPEKLDAYSCLPRYNLNSDAHIQQAHTLKHLAATTT
jgi:hypothetical protein